MIDYERAILAIIKAQEEYIGPFAWTLAKNTTGIVTVNEGSIHIEGTPEQAFKNLVFEYKKLLGSRSVDVSKAALASVFEGMSEKDLPEVFR